MADLLPVDLVSTFVKAIDKEQREPDGKLHPSGDLIGSLRHSMLRAAGAPMKKRPLAGDIRLLHGTLWHNWFHQVLDDAKIPFMYEYKLDEWMPEGWSGTADWVFYHPEYDAWVLGDLKTIKGEGLYWITQKGAKDEHVWQMSAYWHALVNSGLPMLKSIGIMYWPMNDTGDSVEVLPSLQEVEPVPYDVILPVMIQRWETTKAYLAEVRRSGSLLNDLLEPVQDRVQTYTWNKKQEVFDVKLVPHWSAAYCDFPVELCDCATQGTTKIGHYLPSGEYVPRNGYEEHVPTVVPSAYDYNRRRKEVNSE